MNTVPLPISIVVENGKVVEIWYDSDYDNQDYLLHEGSDYFVEYRTPRKEEHEDL
jgi:hypothetical protein